MRVLELVDELGELPERTRVAGLPPRPAHPGLDLRAVALGEVLHDVPSFVPQTALHRDLAEHRAHGLAQRLAAADPVAATGLSTLCSRLLRVPTSRNQNDLRGPYRRARQEEKHQCAVRDRGLQARKVIPPPREDERLHGVLSIIRLERMGSVTTRRL
jgi:hypothetical protein